MENEVYPDNSQVCPALAFNHQYVHMDSSYCCLLVHVMGTALAF